MKQSSTTADVYSAWTTRIGIALACIALASASVFWSPRQASAAALTGVSVTSVTWATDNLVAQTSANWRFTMTNPTALNPGDVIQVAFPENLQGPQFNFQNVSLTSTSGGVWLATTTIAVDQGTRTLGFATTSTVMPSVATGTTFTIIVGGIGNASGDHTQLANLTWTLKTGTPVNPGNPAGALSSVIDGPTNTTQSLVRKGGAIVSDANSGIVPSSYTAGASGVVYTFTFTALTAIPVGGKIAVNFPSEYSLASATTVEQFDINGLTAGIPSVSSATTVTTTGRNQVLLTISNGAVGAGNTVTVQVTNLTNPSTANVYRPFYTYTTTPQGGLIDGAYFGFSNEAYNGPPPVDVVHIGGQNTLIFTAKKDTVTSTSVLSPGEAAQVKIGVACPDKGFFVGERNLTSTSSATFKNILDCNYMAFSMPSTSTGTNSTSFWNSFLQPGFKEIAASGGVKSIDLVFSVPDSTLTGAITGGVANYSSGEIVAFSESHMSWDTLWNYADYATAGLSSTGTAYFSLKARSGTTWQINVPPPWDGMMQSGGNEYWPPSIPAVNIATGTTKFIGNFSYTLANKALNVILRNASTNAVITDACVGVKRSGGGVFIGPQNMICQPNNGTTYRFKVPEGSIAVEVAKPGSGMPSEYPVAVNASEVTSTILISAPTSYIKTVVKDSNLRPISGAPVFMQSSSGFGQAMTDSTGTATSYVPTGTYRVEGFAPGFGPLTAQTGVVVSESVNPTVNFTVDTSAFRSITGRVFIDLNSNSVYNEGTDTPLESIQIGARGTGSTSGGNGTNTLADGTYTLRVPPGTYAVGGWSYKYGGFPEQSVNVSSGNASDINFALAQAGTLEITVVGGADISPLYTGAFDPATGRGNGTDQWTASSTDKFVSLSLPAGTYELHVGAPAFGELTPQGGATVVISGGAITATSYNVSSKATLVTLSGTVQDANSNLLANVNIWVSRVDGPGSFSALTASNGTYSMKIPDTFTYDVGANRSGYLTAHQQVTMAGNRTLNFTLATAGSSITGKVVNSSGSAIADSWVWAEKSATSVWAGAPVDDAGNYSLDVDGGSWTVYAEGPCYFRSTGLAASAGDTGKNITLTAISSCSTPTPQLQSVTPSNGGIVSNGTKATVNIPANALGQESSAVTVSIADADVIMSSPNTTMLSGAVQTITAQNSSGKSITTLNNNVEIVITYDEANLPVGFNENNLIMVYWDATNKKWEPIAATVDPDKNTLTAQINHFTDVGGGLPGGLPDAPQNIAATAASDTQVNLTWNAVSGASSYRVYRASSSAGTYTVVGSPSSASYNNIGLVASTPNYYKVTTVNANGESAYSSIAYVVTQVAGSGGGGGGGGASPGPAPAPTPTPSPETTTTTTTPTVTPSPSPSPLPQPYGEPAVVTLYRVEGDPRVYAVINNTRRHIPNPAAFAANGFAWGAVRVFTSSEAPAYKEAALLRAKGDPKVYSIKNNVKTWIKTAKEFTDSGYSWQDILDIPQAELDAYQAVSGVTVTLKPGIRMLRVRSLPSTSGTVVGHIRQGETHTILETQGDWHRTTAGGWSHAGYLMSR